MTEADFDLAAAIRAFATRIESFSAADLTEQDFATLRKMKADRLLNEMALILPVFAHPQNGWEAKASAAHCISTLAKMLYCKIMSDELDRLHPPGDLTRRDYDTQPLEVMLMANKKRTIN